ncbi:MAG: CotH kinase family protein, partial [Bacteroidota bacterium]
MKNCWNLLFVFILLFASTNLTAQVDHWETVVFAEDEWHYFVGTNEPPTNWNRTDFDASIWRKGQGGFGYGDDDDNTIITNTLSVYLTKKFTMISIENIDKLILDSDFDDGFVAYLNGQELTRANLGEFGEPTTFDQTTPTDQEARLYRGRMPQRVLFQKDKVEEFLVAGENTLAIEVHNVNETSSDLSSNFYLSVGKTDGELEYSLPPDWFEVPVEVNFSSSDLPIMLIETEGQQPIPDEPKIMAKMGLISKENGRNEITDVFNDYDGLIGIERRGSSSQSFPKVGYGFETREEDGSNNNVKLLGMLKENDWVLHGPYTDKSLIRNALAYTIGRALMDYAPRVRFCELMLNGDYQGVYLLTEKIKRDNNRVDINNLKGDENSGDDLTGGYILKIDKFTGANNGGWASDYLAQDNIDFDINFQYDVPAADDITSEQMNYIQNYMSDFEDALAGENFMDAEEGYRKYIDTKTFIRFWIINELAKNVDGYRLSTYFYKDKNSIDSKLKMGPIWDFNLGFGNADYCTSGNPEGWVYNQFNEICPQDGVPIPFWWSRLLEDPDFQVELVEDWR